MMSKSRDEEQLIKLELEETKLRMAQSKERHNAAMAREEQLVTLLHHLNVWLELVGPLQPLLLNKLGIATPKKAKKSR